MRAPSAADGATSPGW